MGIDRETKRGIQRVEREIYKRTGVSSTKLIKKMRMEVDASDYATEGVLSMECEDGVW